MLVMGLQQFEQRLERLVEGAFAKAFRGELQPVELGRRLTREMDLNRAVAVRTVISPNSFEIVLAPEDYSRFEGFVDVLARDLVDAAREHADSEGYSFLGPVEVQIGWSDELSRSTFAVTSAVVEGDDTPTDWIVLPDGRRIGIANDDLTIGRLPECGIPVADPNVSRRHAQLRRNGDTVLVIDLGSTNGTRVNGTPVHQQRLKDGDLVTVGTTTLRFESG